MNEPPAVPPGNEPASAPVLGAPAPLRRRRPRLAFRLLLMSAALGVMAACLLASYHAARRIPSLRPWIDKAEVRLFGATAPRLLTDEMKRAIQAAPSKGRRVRAIRVFRKLNDRLKAAAAEGHDVAASQVKLQDAAILIKRGEYAAAEQLLSKIDFFVPEWMLGSGDEEETEEPVAP